MSTDAELPQDLAGCHALIQTLFDSLSQQQDQLLKDKIEISEKDAQIQKLLQRLYGSRGERYVHDPNQLKLEFGDDPELAETLAEAADELEQTGQMIEYTVQRRRFKQRPERSEKFPEHLPRYETTAEVPAGEQECPTHGPRKIIGYDRTETLEFEPIKLRVRVTLYPKLACENAPECGIRQPERPTGLVEGNRYDTSVVAQVIAAKYSFHLPYYRQQDLFAGAGWVPSRSTLWNLVTAAAFVVEPLVRYLGELVVGGRNHAPPLDAVIGCDETPVTVLMPRQLPSTVAGDPRSQREFEILQQSLAEGKRTLQGRMWAYRSLQLPINFFDFTLGRQRAGPDEVLQHYSGILVGDCWSGFQRIHLRTNDRITHAACWAHPRRYVYETLRNHPRPASVLLALIQQLYDIEERGKTFAAADRLALRQAESQPLVTRIKEYLDGEELQRVLPKSDLATALTYLRNQWEDLGVFLRRGDVPIDNNEVEQLMKQVATGRKNWLFVGSVDAGRRAASMLTLVSSAVRNDLHVWGYLKDVLDQLLAGSTDYEALRPDIWKQSHPEAVRTYRQEERRYASERKSRSWQQRRRELERRRKSRG